MSRASLRPRRSRNWSFVRALPAGSTALLSCGLTVGWSNHRSKFGCLPNIPNPIWNASLAPSCGVDCSISQNCPKRVRSRNKKSVQYGRGEATASASGRRSTTGSRPHRRSRAVLKVPTFASPDLSWMMVRGLCRAMIWLLGRHGWKHPDDGFKTRWFQTPLRIKCGSAQCFWA